MALPDTNRSADAPKLARTPRVSIIILNLNSFEVTLDCLQSLRKIDYPNYEIIVVDNGSVDGSGERLAQADPGIRLMRNEKNVGFGAGCNGAIRDALARGAEYVLLLNNDTILAPDFLTQLIAVAESDPKIGVLNPKIRYFDPPDRLNYAGGEHKFWRLFPAQFGLREKDVGQFDQQREVDFLCGCVMLMKAETIRKVGVFELVYFHFVEDIEWSLRAIRAGYKGVYVPKSLVWHREHYVTQRTQSNGFIEFYLARNQAIFGRKHLRLYEWPLKFSWFWTWVVYRSLRHAAHGEWAAARSIVRGALTGMFGRIPEEDTRL